MADYYPLSDILRVARVHPFYSDAEYPPTPAGLVKLLEAKDETDDGDAQADLASFPVIRKEYKTIARLTTDLDPRNGYRESTYISTTGGGSGGKPMVFATDSTENRRQRQVTGSLMRACGLVGPGDWVITMHTSGGFYRALDLMTEMMECAGASVFCAGHRMSHEEVMQAVMEYKINTIAGDGSQLLQAALYVSSLPKEKKGEIRLKQAIYTSDPLVGYQRAFFLSVFDGIQLCSVLGSAEAGAWAVGNTAMTGNTLAEQEYADFIYDTRSMLLEVFPMSLEDGDEAQRDKVEALPDGEKGVLVQTSLQRLRNPLVRYVCGDLGSLHPLPASALPMLPAEEKEQYVKYLKVVRLYGRDRRFNVEWQGEYFELSQIEKVMKTEGHGVLQWQVVLRYAAGSPEIELEVRILRPSAAQALQESEMVSGEELVRRLEGFFCVFPHNRHLFRVVYVESYLSLARSRTGNKVIKYVDER